MDCLPPLPRLWALPYPIPPAVPAHALNVQVVRTPSFLVPCYLSLHMSDTYIRMVHQRVLLSFRPVLRYEYDIQYQFV